MGIVFTGTFGLPNNAYATCVNTIQAQTIAAAYNGDETPTVHHMDTCSGDDIGYQIPIATTITFDGVEYSNIYATTNSVITFGRADGTYWDYPSTPSISLYSMDWFPGQGGTEGLDIYYSEGGFQINLDMVPYGNYGAEHSTVNILVAITNTGGISVAYSYQGPQYPNLRTGVRLHDGSIVSLESWGATQIQPGESTPTLAPEPISDPSEPQVTPEEQQAQVVEATQLATEIADLNNLIASINGEEPQDPEVIPDPEPTEEPVEEPNLPEPDIVVDPEIIDEEDPRFPDEEEQIQPEDSNPSPDSDTTEEENSNEDSAQEPSEDTSSQEEDKDQSEESQSETPVDTTPSDPSNNNSISEEELKNLNKLISENDAKLLAELVGTNEAVKQAVEEFTARAEDNEDAAMPYTIADAITEVQTEKLLEDPVGTLTSMFTEIDTEVLFSPSEWGKDMTDDQREKVQEIVVSVIIASNIVSAAMTRRTG